MSYIHVLPDLVIDQIAAGEVIERPSSVVKELVENAIDAGATRILVDTEKGGRKVISITDNGKGMNHEDLSLCVKRFATSKINSTEDLNSIRSFGFRGEALPSIGSVSHMTIKSKPADDEADTGHQISLKGGQIQDVIPAVLETGTRIIVENLFYNVPARLEFLKTQATENRRIQQILEAFSLSHLNIQFKYTSDGKEIFNLLPSETLQDRLYLLWGDQVKHDGLILEYKLPNISVQGIVSRPEFQRRDRTQIKFFVNGRYVQSSLLQIALSRFYKDKIPHGTYPFAVISMSLNPERVDVNVHPAKLEIRFRNEGEVMGALTHALTRAFEQHVFKNHLSQTKSYETEHLNMMSVPIVSEELPASWQSAKDDLHRAQDVKVSGLKPQVWKITNAPDEVSARSPIPVENHFLEQLEIPRMHIIGQLKKRYLLIETPEGLMIMDQHAAHERVRYENRLEEWSQRGHVLSQPLLVPYVREYPSEDMEVLETYQERLKQLGLVYEIFGENTIRLDAIPHDEEQTGLNDLIGSWIAYLKDCSKDQPGMEKLIMGSCRYAVMFGDTLSREEQEGLLAKLSQCQSPYSCPHGRPVFFTMSFNEINRKLGR